MIKEPQIYVSCTTQSLTVNQWWLIGDHWEAEPVGLDTAIVGPQCCWTTWMYFLSLWLSRCPSKLFPTHPPKFQYFSFSLRLDDPLAPVNSDESERKEKMPANFHYSTMPDFTCTWAVCSLCIFFQHSHIVSYWMAGPSHFPLFGNITLTRIFATPLALPRFRITVVIMLIYHLNFRKSCLPNSIFSSI